MARLIALFPGTDISVLSMALENYSDPDEAADFVRKTIKSHSDNEDDDSPGFKKPRPQGSARRREKKLSEDSQRQADEDEEFARRLIGGASDRSGDEQDR